MGPVGAGKSFFIDLLTNQKGRRARDELRSSMDSVQATRINHPKYGDRIILVDTPGFDDTSRSDMQILEVIGKWMTQTYADHVKLSGIVYLHRITDNRMGGSQCRNLRTFGELVGDNAMKNVILVSTMWEKVNPAIGKKREEELRERFWKLMVDKGSRTDRLEKNTMEEAWRIVEQVVTEREQREAILLQEEVVNLGRKLNETQAGRNLYNPFQKLLYEQRAFLKGLIEQMKKPGEDEVKRRLELEAVRIEESFRQTFDEAKKLRVQFGWRILLLFLGTKRRVTLPQE
ncbi:hypothetical protein P691DRAFT_813197 [Macrolepiota fuliginosa MF-IS2]|uniref:G domain-containing protein n=1 Tax=Macrolepiota fuliginosa MF-IS2 TaxID=1400762 RepID=A0A9P5WY81_9AGAR|nr:hypothetical protein P691DRAFT_813197 [Macrolepiota fuliginosa MF-IS2]